MTTKPYRIVRLTDGRFRIQTPTLFNRLTGGWEYVTNRGSPMSFDSEEEAQRCIAFWRRHEDSGQIAEILA